MRKNYGISLITLVITIVVIIILTGAIVLSISKNNPITGASTARAKSDISAMKDAIMLASTADINATKPFSSYTIPVSQMSGTLKSAIIADVGQDGLLTHTFKRVDIDKLAQAGYTIQNGKGTGYTDNMYIIDMVTGNIYYTSDPVTNSSAQPAVVSESSLPNITQISGLDTGSIISQYYKISESKALIVTEKDEYVDVNGYQQTFQLYILEDTVATKIQYGETIWDSYNLRIYVSGEKIYINMPDSYVYKLNSTTLVKVSNISVYPMDASICESPTGDIYVFSYGGGTYKIDGTQATVLSGLPANGYYYMNGQYITGYNYDTYEEEIYIIQNGGIVKLPYTDSSIYTNSYDGKTYLLTQDGVYFLNGTQATLYFSWPSKGNITVNPKNGDWYISIGTAGYKLVNGNLQEITGIGSANWQPGFIFNIVNDDVYLFKDYLYKLSGTTPTLITGSGGKGSISNNYFNSNGEMFIIFDGVYRVEGTTMTLIVQGIWNYPIASPPNIIGSVNVNGTNFVSNDSFYIANYHDGVYRYNVKTKSLVKLMTFTPYAQWDYNSSTGDLYVYSWYFNSIYKISGNNVSAITGVPNDNATARFFINQYTGETYVTSPSGIYKVVGTQATLIPGLGGANNPGGNNYNVFNAWGTQKIYANTPNGYDPNTGTAYFATLYKLNY